MKSKPIGRRMGIYLTTSPQCMLEKIQMHYRKDGIESPSVSRVIADAINFYYVNNFKSKEVKNVK